MAEHDLSEKQLIGSRIREVRLSRRMSQADLAAMANISLPHISNIENGKISISAETVIRLSVALKVSSDRLLNIRPEKDEKRLWVSLRNVPLMKRRYFLK